MAAIPLATVAASNSKAVTELPAGLVAVFSGCTSGIGEAALKGFVKSTTKPRVYFVGRSEEAGARITQELKQSNEQGEYTFLSADLSSIKNVDELCNKIAAKEKYINVLFMSQGLLKMGGKSCPKPRRASDL